MKALILFNLKRRFLNKLTIAVNVLLFILILGLFHADHFLKSQDADWQFFYDDSVRTYEKYLISCQRVYQYSNRPLKDHQILIHYDDGFQILTAGAQDEKIIESVREDLVSVIEQYCSDSQPYLSSYLAEIQKIKADIPAKSVDRGDYLWLMGTLIYFLLMNYGSMLAGEVLYEKNNHLLDNLLIAVSSRQHLLSKIIQGYLAVIIQACLALLYGMLAGVIRYWEDGFQGLKQFLITSYPDVGSAPLNSVTLVKAAVIGLILISGLLIVQTLMLLACSHLKNSEQANALQSLFYVLLLVIYYLLMIYGSKEMFDLPSIQLWAYLPLASMYLMSCQLLLGQASIFEGLLAAFINVIVLLLIIELAERQYKKDLLNS